MVGIFTLSLHNCPEVQVALLLMGLFQAPYPMDPVSAEPVVVPVPVPEERDGQSVDAQADWRHRYPHLLLHPP